MNVLLEKSLINTHCSGVDSIVVKDVPGMVRIFIARRDHELWKNEPENFHKLSVALHKHHCDVTLMPIMGSIHNVTMGSAAGHIRWVRPYRYSSPIISTEHGGFVPLDNSFVPISLHKQSIVSPIFMQADVYHTIYVPCYKVAAWWVWEGKEDPHYSSVVWSNDALEDFKFDELNLPMTVERLQEDLALISVKSV